MPRAKPSNISKPRTDPIFPQEIIQQIASHIDDRATALSFARVAKGLEKLVLPQIWRSLDLSIHPHNGDQPRILPKGLKSGEISDIESLMMTPGQEAQARLWLVDKKEEKKADQRHRAAVSEKIKAIRTRGEGRWGLVEEVRLVNRQGMVTEAMKVLKAASPNLRSLVIEAPPQFAFADHRLAVPRDSLEVRMISRGLSFPQLAHVRIGPLAIRYAEFLPLLCSLAPNISSLHLDFDHLFSSLDDMYDQAEGVQDVDFPSFDRDLKLEKMRLSYSWYEHNSVDDHTSFDTVEDLLRRCTRMKQLSLQWHGDVRSDINNLERAVSEMEVLTDLHIDFQSYHLQVTRFPVGDPYLGMPKYPTLRRLVLKNWHWAEIFDKVSPMPNLESIFLVYHNPITIPWPEPPVMYTTPPTPSPIVPVHTQGMIPPFAAQLRGCPKLHIIHLLHHIEEDVVQNDLETFDRLDKITNYNGIIRSLRYCDDEVLQAFFYTNQYEEKDEPFSMFFGGSRPPGSYIAPDGRMRMRQYKERKEEPVSQSYTDYDGDEVPVEVIDEMARVEGLQLGWQGRGVKVGKAAWKVLLDWSRGKPPRPEVKSEPVSGKRQTFGRPKAAQT